MFPLLLVLLTIVFFILDVKFKNRKYYIWIFTMQTSIGLWIIINGIVSDVNPKNSLVMGILIIATGVTNSEQNIKSTNN